MDNNTTSSQVYSVKDFGQDKAGLAKRWASEIMMFEQAQNEWATRAAKITKIYRDERQEPGNGTVQMFALFWSNVQTLFPVVYSRTPKSDVQRRFKDADPVARVACEIAERSLDYCLDCTDRFDRVMRDVVEDYLVVGQGSAWQRYVPHFKQERPKIYVDRVEAEVTEEKGENEDIEHEGLQISNDARETMVQFRGPDGKMYETAEEDESGYYVNGEPVDVLEYEEVIDDYVQWSDMGWNSGARTWDEVYVVWRKAYLTKDEVKARFGENAARDLNLDFTPKNVDSKLSADRKDLFKKATVYEIWDRTTKRVIWMQKDSEVPFDVRDDPLKLTDFFPCPRPTWATQTNDVLFPIPDYVYYQDQDKEINDLTQRIGMMERAIRVRGMYPANINPFRTLLQDASDLDFVPMDQQAVNAFAQMNLASFEAAVFIWPFEKVVSALKSMVEMRQQLIQDVYQITGISDVIRGQSDPNETAEAQAIKAQSSGRRVNEKTKEVARFSRDMLRIKFEIIFNHFDDATIWAMSSAANIPEIEQDPTKGAVNPSTLEPMQPPMVDPYGQVFHSAMKLLRNKALRQFRVDIETDSTVAADDNAEKRRRTEFVTAIGQMIGQAAPLLEKAPGLAPMFKEATMFVARGFKAGRSLENAIETSFDSFMQNQGQNAEAQAQAQAEQAKAQQAQIKGQVDMAKVQSETQRTMIEAQTERRAQEIETGRLALEGLAMERDNNPQVVVQ